MTPNPDPAPKQDDTPVKSNDTVYGHTHLELGFAVVLDDAIDKMVADMLANRVFQKFGYPEIDTADADPTDRDTIIGLFGYRCVERVSCADMRWSALISIRLAQHVACLANRDHDGDDK